MKDLLQRPIIFIGVGRSGTTIISEIVLQHRQLAWISNYQNRFPSKASVNRIRPLLDNKLWQLRGQKQQLNKTPFYNKIAFKPAEAYNFWERITGNDIDFSRSFLLDKTVENEQKHRIRSFFHKMVCYQKKKRLAFKITGPSRIEYLSSIFPDACFIEVTRDPLANIRSLLKVSFWEEKGKHQLWWQGAYNEKEKQRAEEWRDKPALITALQYKKVREVTRAEVEKTGVDYYTVAFEEFVKSPNKCINGILHFAGLQNDKTISDYLKQNQIYNRNLNAQDFFTEIQLKKLKTILE